MDLNSISRYFSLSDGTVTYSPTMYEVVNLTTDVSPMTEGSSVIRFIDGSAEKQFVYSKRTVTLSGSGQIPIGLSRLNFKLPITFSSSALQSITGSLSDIATLPAHRTDTGYAPTTYVLVNGVFELYTGSNPGTIYRTEYYPIITCFFSPPKESHVFDQLAAYSWNMTGEEL